MVFRAVSSNTFFSARKSFARPRTVQGLVHRSMRGYQAVAAGRGLLCIGVTTSSYILKNPSLYLSSYYRNKLDILGVHRLGRLARGLYAPTYSLG